MKVKRSWGGSSRQIHGRMVPETQQVNSSVPPASGTFSSNGASDVLKLIITLVDFLSMKTKFHTLQQKMDIRHAHNIFTILSFKHKPECCLMLNLDICEHGKMTLRFFAESGGRKLNENKALTSKKARYDVLCPTPRLFQLLFSYSIANVYNLPVCFDRFDPYGKTGFAICRICKSSVHQSGSHYCQGCAYKKGQRFSLSIILSFPSAG